MNGNVEEPLEGSDVQRMDPANAYLEELTKLIASTYDKAATYTNLVMVAGYAAFFGIWAYTRDHLTPLTELGAGLCLAISAGVFVFWEVAKMIYTSWSLRELSLAVTSSEDSNNPIKRHVLLQAIARKQTMASIVFHKSWLPMLAITISTAIVGLFILLYGLGYGLVMSYIETP